MINKLNLNRKNLQSTMNNYLLFNRFSYRKIESIGELGMNPMFHINITF